jgi:hypothetical protein
MIVFKQPSALRLRRETTLNLSSQSQIEHSVGLDHTNTLSLVAPSILASLLLGELIPNTCLLLLDLDKALPGRSFLAIFLTQLSLKHSDMSSEGVASPLPRLELLGRGELLLIQDEMAVDFSTINHGGGRRQTSFRNVGL